MRARRRVPLACQPPVVPVDDDETEPQAASSLSIRKLALTNSFPFKPPVAAHAAAARVLLCRLAEIEEEREVRGLSPAQIRLAEIEAADAVAPPRSSNSPPLVKKDQHLAEEAWRKRWKRRGWKECSSQDGANDGRILSDKLGRRVSVDDIDPKLLQKLARSVVSMSDAEAEEHDAKCRKAISEAARSPRKLPPSPHFVDQMKSLRAELTAVSSALGEAEARRVLARMGITRSGASIEADAAASVDDAAVDAVMSWSTGCSSMGAPAGGGNARVASAAALLEHYGLSVDE